MSGRLFRAIDLTEPDKWYLTDDPNAITQDPDQAAVIDSESQWGRWLVEEQFQCAIEIEWLPEDQQLRHLGAQELPLELEP